MALPGDAALPEKAALRQQFRGLRRQLLTGCEEAIRAQVSRVLEREAAGGGCVGLYWPLAGEVDLRPLAIRPELVGRLALPAVTGGRLVYRRWSVAEAPQEDAAGVPAPPPAAGELAAAELALLLVPALAIDRRGLRLGYGGGWYDRLRSHSDWRRVPALAVLPSGCLLERLPRDPWDVPFDGWISERGLERPGTQSP